MTGRVGFAETGSRPTGRAASRLVATRFDPAREEVLLARVNIGGRRFLFIHPDMARFLTPTLERN